MASVEVKRLIVHMHTLMWLLACTIIMYRVRTWILEVYGIQLCMYHWIWRLWTSSPAIKVSPFSGKAAIINGMINGVEWAYVSVVWWNLTNKKTFNKKDGRTFECSWTHGGFQNEIFKIFVIINQAYGVKNLLGQYKTHRHYTNTPSFIKSERWYAIPGWFEMNNPYNCILLNLKIK